MNIPRISFPTINLSEKLSSAKEAVGNFFGRSVTHLKNSGCKTAITVKNGFFTIGQRFQAAARGVANTKVKVTSSIFSGVKSLASKVANVFARIFKREEKFSRVDDKVNNYIDLAQESQAPVASDNEDVPHATSSNIQPAQETRATRTKKTREQRDSSVLQANGDLPRRSPRLAKA